MILGFILFNLAIVRLNFFWRSNEEQEAEETQDVVPQALSISVDGDIVTGGDENHLK